MIVDNFEINGGEVALHLVNNEVDNCFCFHAKNEKNDFINGFEFRVKKNPDINLEAFSQSAVAFAIVSFMRRQIEENHWQVYEETSVDDFVDDAHILASNPRAAGRKAFLNKQHYCNNPFTELNLFAHDQWDQGWAEEAQKHPTLFDFVTDSFQHQ